MKKFQLSCSLSACLDLEENPEVTSEVEHICPALPTSAPLLVLWEDVERCAPAKLPATMLACCCLQLFYAIPYTPQFYMYNRYIYPHHHGQPHTLLGSHWNSHTSILNNLIWEFLPSRMKMQFFPQKLLAKVVRLNTSPKLVLVLILIFFLCSCQHFFY